MKIIFNKDNNLTGWMEIEPHKSKTAATFIEAISQTTKISNTHNHSFTRDKLEVINDFLRLKEITELINQSSYDRKIEVDLDKNFNLQKLFDLHEHFEDLGERYRKNDPTLSRTAYEEIINLGCELNGLIHKLEGSLYGGQWFQALFKQPDIVRIPLTEEIIQEAVPNYKQNNLYVGYGETGKNMAHIYHMNEVELLKRQMVQPQRYIISEFFVSFDDSYLDPEGYTKWCIENGAEELGYDYNNPIWFGKWEVGPIVNKSFSGFSNFPQYDEIRVEL